MKRTQSASDKAHLSRVAEMGCIVCELCYGWPETPNEIHHVRLRHGWGRSSHKAVLPLCFVHHRGGMGVHAMGRAEFKDTHGYSEIELLEIVNRRLGIEVEE